MRHPAQSKLPLSAERRAMLAKINIAKKDLALGEDSYRGLMKRITSKDSASLCSDAQLHKLLGEFRRLGWKPKSGGKHKRPLSNNPKVRMIHAIWGDLRPLLDNADESTLWAFVLKQTGVDAPEFLTSAQCDKVIGGLKGWLERERVKEVQT